MAVSAVAIAGATLLARAVPFGRGLLRWRLKVTFHEVREHLDVETQCQWSHPAIVRTTPALLSLFSLVTLQAHLHATRRKLPIRQAAWNRESQPAFSDALALVRRQNWQHECFQIAGSLADSPNARPKFKIGCFQPCVARIDVVAWIKSS